MKIATFNINSIRNRLPRLLEWLDEAQPDVVCLQELRIYHEEFPRRRDSRRGLRRAVAGTEAAIQRRRDPRARRRSPSRVRRGLPGDPGDAQARYLEAAVDGILIGCLYAPNGNPQPGPKFDYKLAWLERLIAHAAALYRVGRAGRAGRRLQRRAHRRTTSIATRPTTTTRSCSRQSRAAFRRLLDQGWIDAIRALHPDETIYTFWDYMRKRWERNAGLRIDHLLLNRRVRRAWWTRASTRRCGARRARAIMRRRGSRFR